MAYNDYAIRYAHLLRGDYMNGSQVEATKKSAFGRRIDAFKVRHEALWQFIMFNLLSLCATVTDLGVYTLLNSRLLVGLKDISVTWWLLDYSSEAGGSHLDSCGVCVGAGGELLRSAQGYFQR